MRSGRIALLAGAVLALTGCGPLATPPSSGDAARGEALYLSTGCLACHAINGVTGHGGGPLKVVPGEDLTSNITAANYDLLKYYIEVPPKGMEYTKFLHLTPQQLEDIAVFVQSSLKPKAGR
jgi:mono/diheme cytochrome c family protein